MKVKRWGSIGACECSTLSLGTNKDVFPTDKGVFHLVVTDKGVSFISFWCRVHRYIHFASWPLSALQPPSVYSAELSNGKQCRREIDLSTHSCNCQFKPRGRSSETAKKHFYAQLLFVNKQKKAVWVECSAASVLNPNNVCVSRG